MKSAGRTLLAILAGMMVAFVLVVALDLPQRDARELARLIRREGNEKDLALVVVADASSPALGSYQGPRLLEWIPPEWGRTVRRASSPPPCRSPARRQSGALYGNVHLGSTGALLARAR